MTIDIARLRRDTPACETRLHFNNAGASLMPNAVTDVLYAHLDLERRIGGYEAEAAAAAELADFYDAFAALLNCQREEIAWVENATRAWDLAVHALPWQEGDRVLVHASDYASNHLALVQLAQRRGIILDTVPSAPDGTVAVEALPGLIQARTRAIFITHSPTHDGLINPAAEIGTIAREHGLWFVLDGCQSIGQIPVDVTAIGCHVYSGSGRKFLRGPRGTGFLFIASELANAVEPPFIDLHSGARTSDGYRFAPGAKRFECWESYVAGKLGERAAVRYLLELGVEAVSTRLVSLAAHLRDSLQASGLATVLDHGSRKGGIVTFAPTAESAEACMARLRARGINTSVTGPIAAPTAPQWLQYPSAVRASLHAYNTEAEIEHFIRALGGRD